MLNKKATSKRLLKLSVYNKFFTLYKRICAYYKKGNYLHEERRNLYSSKCSITNSEKDIK